MGTTLDQEWKKGSAELLILSLLDDQPRHGYDIGKLIEGRSGGNALPHRLAVSAALPTRESRLDSGALGRKAQSKKAALLPSDNARSKNSGAAAPKLGGICPRGQPNHGG